MADKNDVTSLVVNAAAYREKVLRSLNNLPPFSPILNRLLASLASEDVSFARLAALIEKDTVLAGTVLKVVNSALYGRAGTINSVTHAISIMGLTKLRNTALGFSVNRMWKQVRTPPGWSMARFNLHSVATGLMADLLAQKIPVHYPEGGFVGGLFHDLGKLLIAITSTEDYDALTRLMKTDGRTAEECEKEVLGWTHAELSSAALEQWNLPKLIQMAVEFHHVPDSAPEELSSGNRYHLGHLLYAADQTVNQMGVSLAGADVFTDEREFHELKSLGLEAAIPEIAEEFDAEFNVLKAVA